MELWFDIKHLQKNRYHFFGGTLLCWWISAGRSWCSLMRSGPQKTVPAQKENILGLTLSSKLNHTFYSVFISQASPFVYWSLVFFSFFNPQSAWFFRNCRLWHICDLNSREQRILAVSRVSIILKETWICSRSFLYPWIWVIFYCVR